MCGIVGFLGEATDREHLLQKMAHSLRHRGPDHCGMWHDKELGLSLAHQRLSIIDTSESGHQPMSSSCGRYIISFNGEVYNHLELKKTLETLGRSFKGHSDTEVLVESISEWGFESVLPKINGMFAFALWDKKKRCMTLARDRFGEKPLYFGWAGQTFVFASELKPFHYVSGFDASINREALRYFMAYSYVPDPISIFSSVFKLLPAHFVTFSLDELAKPLALVQAQAAMRRYWQFDLHPEALALDECVHELNQTLAHAVKLRMQADVPLGAFLSGGVDSSAIVSLMQSQSMQRIQTFSIGFADSERNEAEDAAKVAQHLGTDHTECYVSANDAMSVIPKLPSMFDEPFADASQVPTFLVSQLAREKVTVSLSGDAGDELFGGYNRYLFAPRLWQKLKCLPPPLRVAMARLLRALSPASWDRVLGLVLKKVSQPGEKLYKVASAMHAPTDIEFYDALCRSGVFSQHAVLGDNQSLLPKYQPSSRDVSLPFAQRMMAADVHTYLPGDILTKVDRATMAVSLESRIPFLDNDVVALAMRAPLEAKINNGVSKWWLRQVLYKHVPRELIERPKKGFTMPIDEWLRGPLKSWAEDLLQSGALTDHGLLDTKIVQKAWRQHVSGCYAHTQFLWNVLMFQAWHHEARLA